MLKGQPEEEALGLLDRDSEDPQTKLRRYILTGLASAVLLAAGYLYLTRYSTEKDTATKFFDAVVKGDTEAAYRIWQPKPSYTYKDFLDDWGEKGYYGPVKSYQIVVAQRPKNGSGVVVVVEVSPFAPFPANTDREKLRQNKEVKLWVERQNQSIAFAP